MCGTLCAMCAYIVLSLPEPTTRLQKVAPFSYPSQLGVGLLFFFLFFFNAGSRGKSVHLEFLPIYKSLKPGGLNYCNQPISSFFLANSAHSTLKYHYIRLSVYTLVFLNLVSSV